MKHLCAISQTVARRIATAVIMAVVAGSAVTSHAGDEGDRPEAETQPSVKKDVIVGRPTTVPAATSQPAPTSRPAIPIRQPLGGGRPKPLSTGPGTVSYLFASVLVILILGGIAVVVVRKVLPRLNITPTRHIRVIETAYISPKKVLHLVEIGSQAFLVAGNRDSVTAITQVAHPENGGDAAADAEGPEK